MTKTRTITLSGHIGYLGYIPTFVSAWDDRPLIEQLNEGYAHGGGWQPFKGFDVQKHGEVYAMQYPGDPPYIERAKIEVNGETLVAFDNSWVLVIDKAGVNHVARMD
jgi:hypothetical protein